MTEDIRKLLDEIHQCQDPVRILALARRVNELWDELDAKRREGGANGTVKGVSLVITGRVA